MPATIADTANTTHHQRGVGSSITPEMRCVIQPKLRLLRTSGTRASGRSTEAEASPRITSGAVVAPSTLRFLVRVQHAFVVLLEIVFALARVNVLFRRGAGYADSFRVGHLRIRVTDPRQVAHTRVHIQVFEQAVVAVLLFHLRNARLRILDVSENDGVHRAGLRARGRE